jgi:hypothetical protein
MRRIQIAPVRLSRQSLPPDLHQAYNLIVRA